MNIFQRVCSWVRSWHKIESRLGDIFLNISAGCCVGVIISIDLNLIVKGLNGSRMPVFAKAGNVYVMDNDHFFSHDEATLKFLGDWIEIDGEKSRFLKETFFSHIANILHFPLGVDITASPGDIGMWVFIGAGLLALFLPIGVAFLWWAKKNR